MSLLIPSKNLLYSNKCRAALRKSHQQQPGNIAAQVGSHRGTQVLINLATALHKYGDETLGLVD